MYTYAFSLVSYVRSALNSKSGVTSVEYGIIGAGMAVAVVAALTLLGPHITAAFTSIGNNLSNP